MTRTAHVEVYRGRDQLWRFRLVGGNGEKQTGSQPYHGNPGQSKYGAKRGARSAHPGVEVRVAEGTR